MKLLLIQNQQHSAVLSEWLAQQLNAEIRVCGSLEESASFIKAESWDVVFLDLALNRREDDPAVLESWRLRQSQLGDETPAIVLVFDEKTGLNALGKGAQDYLLKGNVNTDPLRRMVDCAMERARSCIRFRLKRDEDFCSLFNHFLDPLLLLETGSGRILLVNAAAATLLQYPRDILKGRYFASLFPDENEAEWARRLQVRNGIFESQSFLRSDGTVCIMDVTATILPWSQSQEAILVSLRDTGERREAEQLLEEESALLARRVAERTQELTKANEDLQRASQAKDTFLAMMSHELRTPMNAVCGFSDSLLQTQLDDKQRGYVQNIVTSSQKLLVILNDILDFSKIEAGRMRMESVPFDFMPLVQEVFHLLRPQISRKGLECHVDLEGEPLPRVLGDPNRVQQILMNLVSNAVKFTDHGEVRVRVRHQMLPRESLHDPLRAQICFTVADTGIGISPEKIKELFQPFTQMDPSATRKYGGTGLGLAICRRLCDLMEGDIFAESNPSEPGTRFHVSLPFQIEENTSVPAVSSSSEHRMMVTEPLETSRFGARFSWDVLVVDDDELSREVAKEFLEQLGCRAALAGHGAEALEMLRAGAFDAVVLDIRMPEMDGAEVARQIRAGSAGEHNRDIYLLCTTASVVGIEREKYFSAGMNDWLDKPLDVKRLSRALSKASLGIGQNPVTP